MLCHRIRVSARRAQEGFSMVAMAAVMLAAGGAAAILMAQQKRDEVWNPRVEAQATQKEVDRALQSYQLKHHRLPCPADPALTPKDANYGVASEQRVDEPAVIDVTEDFGGEAGSLVTVLRYPTLGKVTCVVTPAMRATSDQSEIIGALPFRTLGIQAHFFDDGWLNKVDYAVTSKLANPFRFTDDRFEAAPSRTRNKGSIGLADPNGVLDPTPYAYALISHGQDGMGAYKSRTSAKAKECSVAVMAAELGIPEGKLAAIVARPAAIDDLGSTVDDKKKETIRLAAAELNNCKALTGISDLVLKRGTFVMKNATATRAVLNEDNSLRVNTPLGAAQWRNRPCAGKDALWIQGAEASAGNPACWGGYASLPNALHSTVKTLTSTSGGTGTATFRCEDEAWRIDPSSSCALDCPLPWGGTIASGRSVDAYAASTETGTACRRETRTCTNGVLSGSYTYSSCAAHCSLPWGGTLNNGTSTTAYASAAPVGSACEPQTRTCSDGVLSGNYTQKTCTAYCSQAPIGSDEYYNSDPVPQGTSESVYSSDVSNNCSAIRQTRTCQTNGTWGGSSYPYKSCESRTGCEAIRIAKTKAGNIYPTDPTHTVFKGVGLPHSEDDYFVIMCHPNSPVDFTGSYSHDRREVTNGFFAYPINSGIQTCSGSSTANCRYIYHKANISNPNGIIHISFGPGYRG